MPHSARLPPEAKVVVCGGGAQGAAIAYTLAKRGLAEQTVLIDKVRPWRRIGRGTCRMPRVKQGRAKVAPLAGS